jgi:hypothetical protein
MEVIKMKKLVFNKNLFVRHNEKDFRDDGTNFRFYYYKNQLPISVATACGMKFVCIRLDYAGFRYPDYKEDYEILDMFNGCYDVDMEKLIENCEFILNKYFG